MHADPVRTDSPAQASVSPRILGRPGQPMPSQGFVSTETLFRGGQEILINHHGESYRLRITRNGKLILTK